jgi:potassium/chloride transporter 4/5/6
LFAGAIEVLVIYILPELSFFGDLSMAETKHNNFRFYGTLLLILLTLVVWRGVKVVNKFAAGALVLSFMCQLSVYLGYFVNYNGTDEPSLCLLGRRVVMSEKLDGAPCTNQLKFTGPLAEEFCNKSGEKGCLRYLVENNFTQKKVVLGLASHALTDNTPSSYVYKTGHYITDNGDTKDYTYFQEDPHSYFLRADAPSSFIIALGIFFPSVVGILAGCNRSGDLKDPQTSIPRGTLLACCTTSFVYLSNALLLAGSMDNVFLRDKFGDSLGGRLAMGVIAWPSEWVFLIGALTSTIASAMHNITGAPRLLQALAMDETIPFLRPLMVTAASGEPTRGLIVTFCLTQIFVLIGNLDELNPLLSCFFLMCYGFINLACALQTLLKTPNWRPRFKFYHWAVSASGLTLCIALMFMCSWLYALISMAMAVALYKYIEFNGAKKEWGDGVRGLALSAARYALLRVEEGEPHVKNWRPQILVFVKFDRQTATPKHQPIMSLASQLKTGKGLIMPVTALKGAYVDLVSQAETVKKLMRETMAKEKLKGFSEVLITDDILSGLSALLQISGVGALKPNTVIMGWPNGWRSKKSRREHSWMIFMDMLRNISAAKMTVIVPKGIQFYPGSADKLSGTIDIWWIVHDGGLLVLLPFLLQRHRTWQNCKLRIFTVVGIEGNSIKMKAELNAFLYHARINAEVEIVELDNSEITPYIYERTMVMEQRSRYLSAIGLKRSDSKMILEELVDAHRQRGQLRDK